MMAKRQMVLVGMAALPLGATASGKTAAQQSGADAGAHSLVKMSRTPTDWREPLLDVRGAARPTLEG